jgi:hypothetical protein
MKRAGVVRRNLLLPGFMGTLVVLWAIAGLGLLGPFLHHRANLRAQDWPAATGEVVRFERHLYEGMRGELCELRLRYRYSVGGREYVSRRLWLTAGTPCFDVHLPELGAGEQVPVAYDPRRPRNSVLVRSHPIHRFDFVLAAICVLPAVALLLFGLRRQPQLPVDAAPTSSPPPNQAPQPASGRDNGAA